MSEKELPAKKKQHWIWPTLLIISVVTILLSSVALYLYYVQIHNYTPPQYSFSEEETHRFDEVYARPMGSVAIDVQTNYSLGGLSGSVIKLDDGQHYILTVAHIREDYETISWIRVHFPESPTLAPQEAELLGYHRDWDVALLRFSNPNFVYTGAVARLANSANCESGAKVMAIRTNYDDLTDGFIRERALGGVVETPDWLTALEEPERLWATAVTEAGYSGGPILNQNGEVVAILTGGRASPRTGDRILSFGTRIDWIRPILNDLRNKQSLD